MDVVRLYEPLLRLSAALLAAIALWQGQQWGLPLCLLAVCAGARAGLSTDSVAEGLVEATITYLRWMRLVISAFLTLLALYAISHIYADRVGTWLPPMEVPEPGAFDALLWMAGAWLLSVVLRMVRWAWRFRAEHAV